MIQVNKFIIGTVMTGMSLVALPAMASHISGAAFNNSSFSFDGSDYNGGLATNLNFIDFSYVAEIDTVGNNFAETGGGFFGTFRESLSSSPASGTGINSAFNLYAIFEGTGTQVLNSTGVDLTFTTFEITFYLDQLSNSSFRPFTEGATDGNESITFLNTIGNEEDIAILSGTLSVGGAHIFNGLAAGDFDVLFEVTSFASNIWGGDAFSGSSPILGDFNGVNTTLSGVTAPGVDFIDGRVIGSGNASFQVPEPATLILFSIGLLGAGGMSRRRKSK